MCLVIDDIIYAISAAIVVAADAAPVVGAVGAGLEVLSLAACAAHLGPLASFLGSVGSVFGAVSGVGGALGAIDVGVTALATGTAAGAEGAAAGVATTFDDIYHGYQVVSGMGQLAATVTGNSKAAAYFGGINGLVSTGLALGAGQVTGAVQGVLAAKTAVTSEAQIVLEGGSKADQHDAELLGLGSGILDSAYSLPQSVERLGSHVDFGDFGAGPVDVVAEPNPRIVSDDTMIQMSRMADAFNAQENAGNALAAAAIAADTDPNNPATGTEPAPTPQEREQMLAELASRGLYTARTPIQRIAEIDADPPANEIQGFAQATGSYKSADDGSLIVTYSDGTWARINPATLELTGAGRGTPPAPGIDAAAAEGPDLSAYEGYQRLSSGAPPRDLTEDPNYHDYVAGPGAAPKEATDPFAWPKGRLGPLDAPTSADLIRAGVPSNARIAPTNDQTTFNAVMDDGSGSYVLQYNFQKEAWVETDHLPAVTVAPVPQLSPIAVAPPNVALPTPSQPAAPHVSLDAPQGTLSYNLNYEPPPPPPSLKTYGGGDYYTEGEYQAMNIAGVTVTGGATGLLDYLHNEANSRPDAGVEPTELPPGGTDWSAGDEGGLLSDPVMRTGTGIAVDTIAVGALAKSFTLGRGARVAAGPVVETGSVDPAAIGDPYSHADLPDPFAPEPSVTQAAAAPIAAQLETAYVNQGFAQVEAHTMAEVQAAIDGGALGRLQDAFGAGESVDVIVGNRIVTVEPRAPFSGFTDMEGNTYAIGRDAFTSEEELVSTMLHETYRLNTSIVRSGQAIGQGVASAETATTFDFAQRAVGSMKK